MENKPSITLGKLTIFGLIISVIFYGMSYIFDIFETFSGIALIVVCFLIIAMIGKKIFYKGNVSSNNQNSSSNNPNNSNYTNNNFEQK